MVRPNYVECVEPNHKLKTARMICKLHRHEGVTVVLMTAPGRSSTAVGLMKSFTNVVYSWNTVIIKAGRWVRSKV